MRFLREAFGSNRFVTRVAMIAAVGGLLFGAVGRPATFWLYAAIAVFATGFFAWRVPETKDRTLEQIEADLAADVMDGQREPTGRFQREKGRVAAR